MRRSLTLLVLAGIIPIVGLGGTFGAVTLRNEKEAIVAQGRTDAALAAALLSSTIRSNMDSIRMVAQSPALDGAQPDLSRFSILANRILASQRDWRALALAHSDGHRFFDTLSTNDGSWSINRIDAATLHRLRMSTQPQVGPVVTAANGTRFFAIHAPVGGLGDTRLIVSALVPMARMGRDLRATRLGSGWTASIVTPTGIALISPADGRKDVLAEPPPVEMWQPVSGAHWSVRITAPAQAFLAPLRRAGLLLLVAAVLCVLLLGLLARMLAIELRQARGREASELQRQRMEALGTLTGGVAHDFNNLLTPIMISLELAGRMNTDARLSQHLDAATSEIERARTLVSRLLSFSRQQQLSPEPVDLQAMIDGLSDLIARSLTPAITVIVEVEPGVCAAAADRGQLELAILNLVINARDAMPAGGRLSIQVACTNERLDNRVDTGTFVAITVFDTGSGMSAETRAKAIDPFFTTKAVGKGTGLGLSMVDGFASQSGGWFVLRSVLGEGTSASIILPCSGQPAAPHIVSSLRSVRHLRILLVDDDDRVRRAAAEVLSESGHTVIEAAGVDGAIAILDGSDTIDIVVTDFIMPGRSGGELVELLRSRWPDVAVLMVTGHVGDGEGLPPDLNLLFKPYRAAALLEAVERAFQRGAIEDAAS